MAVESAEMTKHALNAFLATSVTFINEVAALCEQVGADAREVERGLKSDVRIAITPEAGRRTDQRIGYQLFRRYNPAEVKKVYTSVIDLK